MFSGRSLKLATLFGIRVGVSTSWFVVLFVLLYIFTQDFQNDLGLGTTAAFGVAIAGAVLFFGSILLHELGHALSARREGIEVAGIDLFIFGGVMKMNREADSAGPMFRIAVAGPAVTGLIIVLAGALGALLVGWGGIVDAALLDARGGTTVAEQLLSLILTLNVILLVFNLIPALPLDGGQILRSAVWAATGVRSKGTRAAAVLGQGVGYLLMAYGAYELLRGSSFGGIWAIGLGYLIRQGARAATAQDAFTQRLDGVTVADIMDPDPVTIPAGMEAVRAYDEFFTRYAGWDRFAVVEDGGHFAGIAERAAMERAAGTGHALVREVTSQEAADELVLADAPLESLLGSEPLRRLGALMVLDGEGRLRGVVTVEQVSRALRARLSPA